MLQKESIILGSFFSPLDMNKYSVYCGIFMFKWLGFHSNLCLYFVISHQEENKTKRNGIKSGHTNDNDGHMSNNPNHCGDFSFQTHCYICPVSAFFMFLGTILNYT